MRSPDSLRHPACVFASALLIVVLALRVLRGVDMSDEMQYLGQIAGLMQTGSLFSNDLFIQQTVYLLFYPLLLLYQKLFGTDSLLLATRIMLAVISFAVFALCCRRFMHAGLSAITASALAFAVVFGIPYHGIFSLSYNTVSQAAWALFLLYFADCYVRSRLVWCLIIFVAAISHPTSGVVMSALILGRVLVAEGRREAFKLLLSLSGMALILVFWLLAFARPEQYFSALDFSSGFGVGAVWLHARFHLVTLLLIFFGAVTIALLPPALLKLPYQGLIAVLLTIAAALFATGVVGGGYSIAAVVFLCILVLVSFAFARAAGATPGWLMLAIVCHALTLGLTSGNGASQATGALMLGLPLMLGRALAGDRSGRPIVVAAMVPVLFLVHWSVYPYREAPWFRANEPIEGIPALRFLHTSADRLHWFTRFRQEFGSSLAGRGALIVSDIPIAYFLLGAQPRTCMIYMHSVTSVRSATRLIECLEKQQPEFVLDLYANEQTRAPTSAIKTLMQAWYLRPGWQCEEGGFERNSAGEGGPVRVRHVLCRSAR